MKLSRALITPVLVAAAAVASGGWLLQRGVAESGGGYANARLFDEVMRRVSSSFVEQKDSGELYRMAIEGMLQELGDPHSGFLPAEEYEKLRVQTEGEYGGLGVQIIKRGDYITVISPLPGTPGERAGLRAGDAIAEVDGVSTKSWSEDEAVTRLRGEKGSRVVLSVLRAGVDQPIRFEIVRDEIRIRAVPTAYMIAPTVGYVELILFNSASTNELRSAINRLRGEGARRLVLDLRQNPGGLLEEGSQIADLFLPKQALIVETRSRVPGQNQKVLAATADEFPGMPIVVLVGPGSASASEIVAGALQDHDRALVLGGPTYGKGSVQTVFPLGGNNWLKLTTARWYTPVGRSIQRDFANGAGHPLLEDGPEQDSTIEERPSYRTDGGRTVYGGGGITPDLIVAADTLTAQERLLRQELAQHGSEYATQRLKYAVDFIRRTPKLADDFQVTEAMLDEFHEALAAAGVKVDRELFRAARRWVAFDLGFDIAYSRWGQQAGRMRANSVDPQVRMAVELLEQATSPVTLFAAASKAEPVTAAAGGAAGQR